jgi:hypothetical protein
MNILYIDAGNVLSENHMYPYYGGVYRELIELANVTTVQGYVKNINNLLSRLDQKFDCIIFGLGYFANGSLQWFGKIEGLSEIKVPVIAMIHKPQTLLKEKLEFCKINRFNLIVDSQCTFKEFEKITGIKSIKLPMTASPNNFYPRTDVVKKYDIGFSGALHGNGKIKGPTQDLRTRVKQLLDNAGNYKVFWNGSDSIHTRINSVEDYASKINECKVWISTTGPMLDIGPRYFEVMLSKTLLFCNEMEDANKGMFEDGITCATFKNDLSDFEEKLSLYLKNDEIREKVVINGYNLVLNNYTWRHMAIKLLEKVKELSNEKDLF